MKLSDFNNDCQLSFMQLNLPLYALARIIFCIQPKVNTIALIVDDVISFIRGT